MTIFYIPSKRRGADTLRAERAREYARLTRERDALKAEGLRRAEADAAADPAITAAYAAWIKERLT